MLRCFKSKVTIVRDRIKEIEDVQLKLIAASFEVCDLKQAQDVDQLIGINERAIKRLYRILKNHLK